MFIFVDGPDGTGKTTWLKDKFPVYKLGKFPGEPREENLARYYKAIQEGKTGYYDRSFLSNWIYQNPLPISSLQPFLERIKDKEIVFVITLFNGRTEGHDHPVMGNQVEKYSELLPLLEKYFRVFIVPSFEKWQDLNTLSASIYLRD